MLFPLRVCPQPPAQLTGAPNRGTAASSLLVTMHVSNVSRFAFWKIQVARWPNWWTLQIRKNCILFEWWSFLRYVWHLMKFAQNSWCAGHAGCISFSSYVPHCPTWASLTSPLDHELALQCSFSSHSPCSVALSPSSDFSEAWGVMVGSKSWVWNSVLDYPSLGQLPFSGCPGPPCSPHHSSYHEGGDFWYICLFFLHDTGVFLRSGLRPLYQGTPCIWYR